MRTQQFNDIILDIYRELYENAEPKGDFDELVANATIDQYGRKHIPFMDYEISQYDLDRIIDEHLIKHKLKGPRIRSVGKKIDASCIRNTVYLGCSPKTKREK